ncbi:MAG: hypothetical protein KQI78_01075 [Deltaproteobacteria bacterium]|nr:hypothetical protein [Deltaproteobacteria bacterium]
MAKTITVGFDQLDQITGFVKGIPTNASHQREHLNLTGLYFGPKFGGRIGLATFDGSHVGL